MSLARTLLEGANYGTASLEGYDYSGKCVNENTWVDAACESLHMDIFNVDKAYMVADVIGEVKVIQEGADPAVLLEGIIKSGIDKIIAAFKKFWAKIKEFFANVKEWFKRMTTHGKEFANQFRKQIMDKKYKGFSYTGYEYDLSKGDDDGAAIFNRVEAEVNLLLSHIEKAKEYTVNVGKGKDVSSMTPMKASNPTYNKSTGELKFKKDTRYAGDYKNADDDMINNAIGFNNVDGAVSTSDYQDKFIKDTLKYKGASDTSELQENLEETYHKGSDGNDTFDDFEGTDRSAMLDLLTSFDKVVSDTTKAEKNFDKLMSGIIKKFDGVKKDDVGDAGMKVASRLSSYMSSLLTVGKIPSTVKVAMYKEAAGTYERVLKQFLSFKPAKEGYGADDDDDDMMEGCKESTSLFESAYQFL